MTKNLFKLLTSTAFVALLLADAPVVAGEKLGVRGAAVSPEEMDTIPNAVDQEQDTLVGRELLLDDSDVSTVVDMAQPYLEDLIEKGAKKMATKLVTSAFGGPAGMVFSGVITALGFIGDAVQREKCMLPCCPHENLAASWSCKYQKDEASCKNSYSNYPGHGDHACFWNPAEDRCEAGPPCRDQTFNGFQLVGSSCGACPNDRADWGYQPQWTKEELTKNGMPERFHVDEWGAHSGEYAWCPLNGVPNCFDLSTQDHCETSYADHDGDKSCQWYNGSCRPGKECDNSSARFTAASNLGIEYRHYAWRRISTGQPLDDFTCRWGQATRVRMARCPSLGVGNCNEHKYKSACNNGYMDHYGDKMCKWNSNYGRCEMSSTPCHDGGIQWEYYQQDESVCLPSTKEPFPTTYKVQLVPEKNEINVYAPRREKSTGKYTLLGVFPGSNANYCIDRAGFNAGYGDCTIYTYPKFDFNYCGSDSDNGILAEQACSECQKCIDG